MPIARGLAGSTGEALVQYEKQLSMGAIGTIWLGRFARGAEIGRLVTVRRVPLEWLDESDIERARLATGAFARLRSPSLLKLLDFTQSEREVIGISEYLAGVRLTDLQRFLIETETSMPAGVAVRLVLEVAKAALVAHREMSSWGILTSQRVVFSDGVLIALFGETLLTDVGLLASLLHCSRVAALPTVIAGLSPEEILNPEVSCGSPEVFTLGVALWELLANRWLYSRHLDTAAIRHAVAHHAIAQIDSMERLGLPVPKPVARIVAEATERDPRKRIGSLEALVEAMNQLPSQWVASIEQLGDCIRKFAPQILPECAESAVWPLDAEHGHGLVRLVAPAAIDASELHNWEPPTFAERQLIVPTVESPRRDEFSSASISPVLTRSLLIEGVPARKRLRLIVLGLALFLVALASTMFLLRLRRHRDIERVTAESVRSAQAAASVGSSNPQSVVRRSEQPATIIDDEAVSAGDEPSAVKSAKAPISNSEPQKVQKPTAASRTSKPANESLRSYRTSPYYPNEI
jgi:hypothetical protein